MTDRTPRLPRAERIQKLIDRLHHYAGNLDPNTVNTISHRGGINPGPDGYPTGGDGGPRPHGVSRPTENTVINLIRVDDTGHGHWRQPHDPVGAAAWAWWVAVSEAHDALRRAERARQLVLHLGDSQRGRKSSLGSECMACERQVLATSSDRIKAGYCPACYMAWRRAGMPDRLGFERDTKTVDVDVDEAG